MKNLLIGWLRDWRLDKRLIGGEDEPDLIATAMEGILLNSLTLDSISRFNVEGLICMSFDAIPSFSPPPLGGSDYLELATKVLTMWDSNVDFGCWTIVCNSKSRLVFRIGEKKLIVLKLNIKFLSLPSVCLNWKRFGSFVDCDGFFYVKNWNNSVEDVGKGDNVSRYLCWYFNGLIWLKNLFSLVSLFTLGDLFFDIRLSLIYWRNDPLLTYTSMKAPSTNIAIFSNLSSFNIQGLSERVFNQAGSMSPLTFSNWTNIKAGGELTLSFKKCPIFVLDGEGTCGVKRNEYVFSVQIS